MNSKYKLQILESIEEINLSSPRKTYNVTFVPVNSCNYGLLIYSTDSSKISFIKLSFNESKYLHGLDNEVTTDENGEKFAETCLLNIFCLPFGVFDIIYNNSNIWAFGQKAAVDIKTFVESSLSNYGREDDMDIDEPQQYDPKSLQIIINPQKCVEYEFYKEDIFISCNFLDNSFVLCHKNLNGNVWQLKHFFTNPRSSTTSSLNCTPFLDIPILFDENDANITAVKDPLKTWAPTVLLISHDDCRSHSLFNLFGIQSTFSDVICLIGHPNGKLLWSIWFKEKLLPASKLRSLYNVKQPIIDIHFVEKTGEFKDCEILLVIGAFGQLTLFSPKKLPSFSLVTGNQPFWCKTVHLKPSFTSVLSLNDCLLHISVDESLCTADISTFLNSNAKDSHSNSHSSGIHSVEKMIILNKTLGILLLKTSHGNMYAAVCKKKIDSNTITSSLPSLMNECMQQSIRMQELLHVKVLQSKLFAALSTITSLKHGACRLEEPVFSISELNVQPKKYMLVVNLKSFEKLHLDSDLFYISGSVFTYFQDNYTLVSKTMPYNPDDGTLCLELIDNILQAPFISIFPLFVEIGTILQLPDKWKHLECFKIIMDCLPIYVRIQTFMVHEFHLFQSNILCKPQYEKSKLLLEAINQLRSKRPISKLMETGNENFNFPTKFTVCLSTAFIKERMKITGDADPCKYIEQFLFKTKQEPTEENPSKSPNCPLSVSVAKSNNYILITLHANSFDSLVGLKIAVLEMILISQSQKKMNIKSSYVNIPASIYKRCEALSKSVMDLYGKDVESSEITNNIVQIYQELRRDISGKLPIL